MSDAQTLLFESSEEYMDKQELADLNLTIGLKKLYANGSTIVCDTNLLSKLKEEKHK